MRLILFALLSALCLLRIPAVVKIKESRASWLASVFGLIALYTLGIVTPLETIDRYLGGVNVANLLQAIFALLVLTVTLFDDGAATGFDDELDVKTPRQDFPGGAFVVMVAA